VKGVVSSVRHEPDGDYHVDVRPDPGYRRLLDEGNRLHQGGALVTEIMPGQRLPVPAIGEHVQVFGTWVYDTAHGWNEIHPIWVIDYLDRGVSRYRLPPAVPEFDPDAGDTPPSTPTSPPSNGGCTSGYSPCLPPASDYDCAGGSGDGPEYVTGPVRVTGPDPYGLDADADGIGCE
jgi:hypothetical protein